MSEVLELPLPAGMRDLLPDEAASRAAVSRAMLGALDLWGYRAVDLPVFEFAGVVERGLGAEGSGELLHFVEPESGEIATLRPDMTPQIARIIATRLRGLPPPYRLSYEGAVVRRRAGRARKHRQVAQIGAELAGAEAGDAEVELLSAAADALRATGLSRFTIDLSDAGIVEALVAGAPRAASLAVTSALRRKDEAELADVTRELPHGETLVALARLHGGEDVVRETLARLAGTPARPASERLAALFRRLSSAGLEATITVDPADVRGFSYYTGATFDIYAEGNGFSLGGGGRYDALLGRFGAPMPAAGFAVDVDAVERALAHAEVSRGKQARCVTAGLEARELASLRAAGIAATAAPPEGDTLAYARAWGVTLVVDAASVVDVATGARHARREGENAAASALRVLKGSP